MPQFGRGGLIEGTVTLDSDATQNVSALEVKVRDIITPSFIECFTHYDVFPDRR